MSFLASTFKLKKSVVIFLIAIFIFSSTVSYASGDTSQQQTTATTVEQIKDFAQNRWPVIFTGAVVGGNLCGFWCVIIGGAVAGVVDGVSNHLGYANSNYLTRGMWGLVIANKITSGMLKPIDMDMLVGPNWVMYGLEEVSLDIVKNSLQILGIDAAGFIVGILLPAGVLEKIPSQIVAPATSMMMGGSKLAKMAGIVDELVIATGYTDNHYLTFGVLGKNTAGLWSDNQLITYLGFLLGSAFSYFFESSFVEKIQSAVETHKKAYGVYGKVLPKEYLDLQKENYDIFYMGNELLFQIILVALSDHFKEVKSGFQGQDWGVMNRELRSMIFFVVLFTMDLAVKNRVTNHYNENLRFALSDQIDPQLVHSRVAGYPNVTVLTDNLISDLRDLVPAINDLRADAISSLTKGTYGFGMMIKVGSPNIPIYAFLYSQLDACFADKISSGMEKYMKEVKRLESERNSMIKDNIENNREIMKKDGLRFAAERVRKIDVKLRDNVWRANLYNGLHWPYRSLVGWVDYVASFGLAGNEIRKKSSLFTDRENIQDSTWRILAFFSWFKNSAEAVAKIERPLNNTATLVDLITRATNNNDKIVRKVEGNELILEDLKIGYEKKILVDNPGILSLEMGKIYAITGKNGSGKTSLLTKIKGIEEENGAFGRGRIYYPKVNGKPPKMVMITQRDYFPAKLSLEEVIYYPDNVSKNGSEKLVSLLQELDIRGFNKQDVDECFDEKKKLTLASRKKWKKELSGGEKKKIALASAIIKKPDILIIDELFDALDPDIRPMVQKIIKKYLPGSLILVVDHQAQNNNYDGFYDGGELHLVDQKIIHREMTGAGF